MPHRQQPDDEAQSSFSCTNKAWVYISMVTEYTGVVWLGLGYPFERYVVDGEARTDTISQYT